MLKITIPSCNGWDEKKEEFVYFKGQTLALEHSLVAISKWESKWHIPFMGKDTKTNDQILDYIRCMTITQNVPEDSYSFLTDKNLRDINDYINDSMTATWFNESTNRTSGGNSGKVVTSELIYYWMIAYNIPPEYQKWHLSRLLTLINVCRVETEKQDRKMNKREVRQNNSALNAARRARLNSKG